LVGAVFIHREYFRLTCNTPYKIYLAIAGYKWLAACVRKFSFASAVSGHFPNGITSIVGACVGIEIDGVAVGRPTGEEVGTGAGELDKLRGVECGSIEWYFVDMISE
jgi:hypothetical protein